MTIEEAISRCRDMGGTDVHIIVNYSVHIRVMGDLKLQPDYMDEEEFREFIEKYDVPLYEGKATDASMVVSGITCRFNIYWERGKRGMAIRLLSAEIPELENLKLPAQVNKFLSVKNGMVLVTGTVGSGKTTTIAAMINEFNKVREGVILTVEDPIEFRHESNKCLVIQREVGKDVASYNAAIIDALRQDINIVLVGELREKDTIDAALTLAETGHLVFGTVHTKSLPEAIERMAGTYPPEVRDSVVGRMANVFRGGVHMRLVKKADGKRIAFPHVMYVDNKIRNAIEARKYSTVNDLMVSDPNCYSDIEAACDIYKKGTPMDAIEPFLSPDDAQVVYDRLGLTRELV